MSEAVKLFKVLADETRLRILNLLCRRELCVCQIVDVLGIGQSKVSRHLAHLRHAGLVTDRRDGLWVYYSLSDPCGGLRRRMVEWLRQAEDEIPMGAADLRALSVLGECADLCPTHTPSKEAGHCKEAAAVGS